VPLYVTVDQVMSVANCSAIDGESLGLP
jgi:hypothetical protein